MLGLPLCCTESHNPCSRLVANCDNIGMSYVDDDNMGSYNKVHENITHSKVEQTTTCNLKHSSCKIVLPLMGTIMSLTHLFKPLQPKKQQDIKLPENSNMTPISLKPANK